jgi:IS5 family transposase
MRQLNNAAMFHKFAALKMVKDHLPDEDIICRFRHQLETQNLNLHIPAVVV